MFYDADAEPRKPIVYSEWELGKWGLANYC